MNRLPRGSPGAASRAQVAIPLLAHTNTISLYKQWFSIKAPFRMAGFNNPGTHAEYWKETQGSPDEVSEEIKSTGLSASWSGQRKDWRGEIVEQGGHKSWTEHYVSPKDANGVLCTLASIV